MEALARVCPKCGRRFDVAAAFCQTDGTPLHLTDEEKDPYIGQTLLDQFKIEEKIGAGGMGAVYRARQTTLHRDVAIKILHAELADNRDAVRRFKREARVSTALDHPNVVRVFLFGQLPDGSLYIVMEYLRGRSLLEVIEREGSLPVHRALHVATQVCDGVGEAHNHGVVHRDLKPENVVLVNKQRDSDFVKVLDFGIARVLWGDDKTQATQSGLVFGTARYISPEGAAGEPTDMRSDVYSLGVLTYQLLAGETPFDAPSPVGMLMKHLHSVPPHLLTLRAAKQVPPAIAEVIMRALSKNPEGRYDDGNAFGDALRNAAVASGFEVLGRRPQGMALIGPPSDPGIHRASLLGESDAPQPIITDSRPSIPAAGGGLRADETERVSRSSAPVRESATLQGAPSPFGEETVGGIPAVPVGGSVAPGTGRLILMAFAIGAALVLGGFGVSILLKDDSAEVAPLDVDATIDSARAALGQERYDEPRADSVLGLTDRVLEARPQHSEALQLRAEVASRLSRQAAEQVGRGHVDEARALYERALAFTPDDGALLDALASLETPLEPSSPPGIRTDPVQLIERRPVVLSAVLEQTMEIGARTRPRFVIKRGTQQVGGSIAAIPDATGRAFSAPYTFARSGAHQVFFRIGNGDERIEMEVTLTVDRDPSRPTRGAEPEPPPITTQGGWLPPQIAPAWTPTTENPAVRHPAVDPEDEPPSPPAPWTGGGSVL